MDDRASPTAPGRPATGALVCSAVAAVLAGCAGGPEAGALGPGGDLLAPMTVASTLMEGPVEPAEPKRLTAPLAPRPGPYRIRTGDVLTISVLGEPDMTRTMPVGPEGRISYYIAHSVVAAGRTFEELRNLLAERLRVHFKQPQLTVSGHEYKGNTAAVLGFVGRPGQYVVRSDTRLLDVIAMAGGVAKGRSLTGAYEGIELADMRNAFVLRDDAFVDVDFEALFSKDGEKVAVNNVPILAGDRVYIPSSSSLDNKVFVLGEVNRPRVFRFQRDVSLLEAIAEAGGVTDTAWERRAFVVRGSLKRPSVIPVDLRKLTVGAAPDVALRSGDIVFVPKTALGKLEEVTRQILPFLQSANAVDG
jgi:polysaccharide export outer membrane protein